MIKKVDLFDNQIVFNLVSTNKYKNLYLYLDYSFYGIESSDTEIWIQKNNQIILNVILKYRNSIQLMNIAGGNDLLEEISSFLKSKKTIMVSGEKQIIESLSLNEYKKTNGFLMKYNGSIVNNSKVINIKKATSRHLLLRASKLVCSDDSIGGNHYTVDDLCEQFLKRQKEWGCKNYVLLDDKNVVGHVATYAESFDIAIIGGLIVDKRYRGNNYGELLLSHVCDELISEGKTPFLYCYSEALEKYYAKMGWQRVLCVSKLEKSI